MPLTLQQPLIRNVAKSEGLSAFKFIENSSIIPEKPESFITVSFHKIGLQTACGGMEAVRVKSHCSDVATTGFDSMENYSPLEWGFDFTLVD